VKRIVILFVVAAPLAAAAGSQARPSWYANQWRSPTRNIACRYFSGPELVKCETENDAFALAVAPGTRGFRTGYTPIPYRVPVLRYGAVWIAPYGVGIRCFSSFNGMTCRAGGHGFFINRTSYRLW
jgi:hypothetical protein